MNPDPARSASGARAPYPGQPTVFCARSQSNTFSSVSSASSDCSWPLFSSSSHTSLAELERSITEEKVFAWLLEQSTVNQG